MARDPYRYFRIEARELLDQLGRGVLDLEKGPSASDAVAQLLRLAHTLKGAARVVRQQEIAEQAHAVEDALATVRESAAPASREAIDVLLKRLDDIGTRVAALTPSADEAAAGGTVPAEELFRALRPDVHEMEVLLETVAEAQGQLLALQPFVSRLERARHLAELVRDHLASPTGSDSPRPGDRTTRGRARSLADELHATFGALEQGITRRVDQIGRELREVRRAAERLRLVPASVLFTYLERAARDTARALGKRVVFTGHGGDIRVDAQVLSVAQGALLQVVRNAVAHGIEPAADRRSAGKTPEGRVVLDVRRRGARVVFACEDDGRGVDLAAVRAIVHRKGLVSAHIDNLGPEDLLAVLLRGGISTSGTVTDVSGRGIGLDVVREAAERLGGEAGVRTRTGKGTTVEISVPLTVASFPALLVETSQVPAIVPLDAVRGSLRVSPDHIIRTAQGQSVVYDGRTIPFGSLARALAPHSAAVRTAGPSSAIVIEGRVGLAAFGVDRIVGTANVVLRPLPDLAPAAPFVAGVSLDDEGIPRVVIDPDALLAASGQTLGVVEAAEERRPSVLVIDDSLTTRMLEQSILESAGYIVDVATSGEEALEKARAVAYSLFLVDIEMPGMDGFTFIERAKADPVLRGIPSILVTSRSSSEDQRRGEEVGAQAYIVKSEFDQAALLERIRGLVG